MTRAATTALGPGTTSICTFRSIAARTKWYPGSESPGIPASETSTTVLPAEIASTSSFACRRSLFSWYITISGVGIP
jgi:hypothetical protein